MNVEATVRIGKNGITPGVLEELRAQLKNRKIVKIKFLRNTEHNDINAIGEDIAHKVNGEVVEVRGFTITIKKK